MFVVNFWWSNTICVVVAFVHPLVSVGFYSKSSDLSLLATIKLLVLKVDAMFLKRFKLNKLTFTSLRDWLKRFFLVHVNKALANHKPIVWFQINSVIEL